MQRTRTVSGLGRAWKWPESDTECLKVIFGWMSDLERTMRFCKQKRTAIQAGGNMGVWPWVLSASFDNVVTAEPDEECFRLLQDNLAGVSNVDAYHAALYDTPGFCALEVETNNRGAQFIIPKQTTDYGMYTTPRVTIDSFEVTDCDLIYLDIEGAELKALQGARQTITASKPVIALEDKGLSTRFGTAKYMAEKWLEVEFGYKVVGRFHNDVVLTCE